MTEGFQRQIQILIERNKQLVQENLVLKKEVVQLKKQISVNKTTASRRVIITLDQGSQQVEVLPSLVTDCKKPLHQNRLFWGSGIGYF